MLKDQLEALRIPYEAELAKSVRTHCDNIDMSLVKAKTSEQTVDEFLNEELNVNEVTCVVGDWEKFENYINWRLEEVFR